MIKFRMKTSDKRAEDVMNRLLNHGITPEGKVCLKVKGKYNMGDGKAKILFYYPDTNLVHIYTSNKESKDAYAASDSCPMTYGCFIEALDAPAPVSKEIGWVPQADDIVDVRDYYEAKWKEMIFLHTDAKGRHWCTSMNSLEPDEAYRFKHLKHTVGTWALPTDENAKQRPSVLVKDAQGDTWVAATLVSVTQGSQPYWALDEDGDMHQWVFCKMAVDK